MDGCLRLVEGHRRDGKPAVSRQLGKPFATVVLAAG